jgi:hypothetical protein
MARTKGKMVVVITDKVTGERTAYKSLPKATADLQLTTDLQKIRYNIKAYGIYDTKKLSIEYVKLIDTNNGTN